MGIILMVIGFFVGVKPLIWIGGGLLVLQILVSLAWGLRRD